MQTATPRFSREKLRALRLARGFTQSELARRGQLREQQIIRWEGGKNTPSADAVGILAAALGCEVSSFFVDGSESAADDDEEEASLLDAAHALDRAGEYSLADTLRRRARDAARARVER